MRGCEANTVSAACGLYTLFWLFRRLLRESVFMTERTVEFDSYHLCRNQRMTLDVFFCYLFLLRIWKQGLTLNLELTVSLRLANQ